MDDRKNYYCLPESVLEADLILVQNDARISVTDENNDDWGYSLVWEHGAILLQRNFRRARIQAAAFVLMWNSGMDAADASEQSHHFSRNIRL
jgi:hypothetical protein